MPVIFAIKEYSFQSGFLETIKTLLLDSKKLVNWETICIIEKEAIGILKVKQKKSHKLSLKNYLFNFWLHFDIQRNMKTIAGWLWNDKAFPNQLADFFFGFLPMFFWQAF